MTYPPQGIPMPQVVTRFPFMENQVVFGLVPATSATLTSDISAGEAIFGRLLVVIGLVTRTYTASRDTYIDLTSDGVYHFAEVLNFDHAPPVVAGAIRVAMVRTSATAITHVSVWSRNLFVGGGAGSANTTGFCNVFIGRDAGRANTTGFRNVFIGLDAGRANTTGFSNVFIGREAGLANTDGFSNVFIGLDAGRANTTGGGNVFIGREAGRAQTTGYSNIFIGRDAGRANTTGFHNVFIGAGPANTTGSSNVFIGAGDANTTGSGSVFIGIGAGNANTIGSGNVFIGRSAGHSEVGSNRLYIANSDTTRPLIYGEFDTLTLRTNSLAATSAATLRNSPTFTWRGAFWTGVASADRDFTIQHIIDSVAPRSTARFTVAGLIGLQLMNDAGRIMMIVPHEAVEPPAAAALRGALMLRPGGVGVTDTLVMCMKAAADTWSWRTIATGG